ncbi:YdeI/OmpD-associated family protein [Maribellus mangrovi]|uniref:YdeI/OmpD-associated family protein n=1 Tax=Maribellus mangrovi TaxID=3133146 RepID=UPI0030EE55FB
MNPTVDAYLADGCGRCAFYATTNCKVNNWQEELKLLRRIVLDCGLNEELKWKQPCYTWNNKNILLVTAFKEFAAVAFFKGSLLKDPRNLLTKPGDNSQATHQFRFTDIAEIKKLEADIKAYIYEAIEVEKAGLKIAFKKEQEPVPDELQKKFDEMPEFKIAFEALTPGRQRGYILYFSAAKQTQTRESRIEKYMQYIFNGKGIHDH